MTQSEKASQDEVNGTNYSSIDNIVRSTEHGVMSRFIHSTFASNLESKMLTTPKLKELQSPKIRVKQPLLVATIPPYLM